MLGVDDNPIGGLRLRLLAALVLGLSLLGACHRNRTSEEIRQSFQEADDDSTWMRYPCQLLVVDEFGWRADSVGPIKLRVHPSLETYRSTWNLREYRTPDNRSRLSIRYDGGPAPTINGISSDLQQRRFEECTIANRVVVVVTGRASFEYHTRMIWYDVGDEEPLIVRAVGRSTDEVQILRAVLFTMKMPR